jgi:hypothetical protein
MIMIIFLSYRNRFIIDKYVNLEATEDNFNKISVLNETKSEYFELRILPVLYKQFQHPQSLQLNFPSDKNGLVNWICKI